MQLRVPVSSAPRGLQDTLERALTQTRTIDVHHSGSRPTVGRPVSSENPSMPRLPRRLPSSLERICRHACATHIAWRSVAERQLLCTDVSACQDVYVRLEWSRSEHLRRSHVDHASVASFRLSGCHAGWADVGTGYRGRPLCGGPGDRGAPLATGTRNCISIMTSGGMTPQKRWREVDDFPFTVLHKKWQYHLFTMLKQRGGTRAD